MYKKNKIIKVKVIHEQGFVPAILSGRISRGFDNLKKSNSIIEPTGKEIVTKEDVAWMQRHCNGKASATKWMRQVVIWTRIDAARFFWQEFDTYKIGVEKGSDSTMYNLVKKGLSTDDFAIEPEEKEWWQETVCYINSLIELYNNASNKEEKVRLKRHIKSILPESYIQTRFVMLNYQVLKSIYNDRKRHELTDWQIFLSEMKSQIRFPELIWDKKDVLL